MSKKIIHVSCCPLDGLLVSVPDSKRKKYLITQKELVKYKKNNRYVS